VRRRLLLVVLLLSLAAGAGVAWQARSQGRLVERDLATVRDLLGRSGGFGAGQLGDRLVLLERADAHARNAEARLGRWPLRQLGALPLLGRDARVATAVAASATRTVAATRKVVVALQPVQTRAASRPSILRAADALLGLHGSLDADLGRVRAARPLLAARARDRYLQAAAAASATAQRAGAALRLGAGLYGPPGTARWFLAFQNPAELRGTGGLIGQYGILESSPSGPTLTTVAPYQELESRTRTGVPLPRRVARRYGRFAVNRAWSAVNIPPDLPTVGRIVTGLYRRTTGDRLDGVIAADPLAVAEVLRAGGPVTVAGVRVNADNVAEKSLVDAYIRYVDNNARRRFLERLARATFEAFRRALVRDPVGLMRGLAGAARGRHVQVYARDPAGQRALLGLGIAGSAAAPVQGDYLMAVGNNAGGNKLDAFLHRRLDWRVRLAADGSARAALSLTLRNAVPPRPLPRYIVGPYDRRFRPRVNEQIQTLYVDGGYGFTRASLNGRRVGAEAQAELGALALTQRVAVGGGGAATLGYRLQRPDAADRVGLDRLRYRLLLRPQATRWPDRARVAVTAPDGWEFTVLPPGARAAGTSATWSGALDREHELTFVLERA
jgi:Protein of unknown function (DUF4012)